MTPILSVSDLKVQFGSAENGVRAVDDVSFALERGETLGIVGESGSGKSVTGLSLLRLISKPGRVIGGSILFDGRDLLAMDEKEIRSVRGREISMIFQDPMTSLNPVLTIGRQLTEILEVQGGLTPGQARTRAVELLALVGIPSPERRLGDYPHHFSGGMRQRVMIAIAVACRPKLLIADEPTTALDVTIQAQILDILKSLQKEIGMALILITHDLGIVAGMADRIAVMYGGRIVEEGPTDPVFEDPRMPYTVGLLRSTPRLDRPEERRLRPIRGLPVAPRGEARFCRFAPRCDLVEPVCTREAPQLEAAGAEGQRAACHFAERVPELLHTQEEAAQ
ncbi:ABC transporter ATP-binding protein [Microvirga sp. BT689]|uniref:ABC transporter ATP-binding protein n=1 Tax=Microvirga arvi TaxID=2778731 RepID=UPI00194FE23F|nr:ABC transporter ATP-binding protein [Microvirga arvi]MBM6581883.1 ABC transporter ATP-binding protein [Microvirga arvi]